MKKNYSGYHKPNSKKFAVFRGGGINYWKRISRDAKSLFMFPYSDGTYDQINGILTQITENMPKDENPKYTWGIDPISPENAATPQTTRIAPSHGALDGERPSFMFADEEVNFKNGIMDWWNGQIAAKP